jgi:hypothetical protein
MIFSNVKGTKGSPLTPPLLEYYIFNPLRGSKGGVGPLIGRHSPAMGRFVYGNNSQSLFASLYLSV